MTYRQQAQQLIEQIEAGAINLPHTVNTQAAYNSYKVYFAKTRIVPRENPDGSITLYPKRKTPKVKSKRGMIGLSGKFCNTQNCPHHQVISLQDGWKRKDHCKRYGVNLVEKFNERGVPLPLRDEKCIKEFGA